MVDTARMAVPGEFAALRPPAWQMVEPGAGLGVLTHTLMLAAPKRKTPGPKAGIPTRREAREKRRRKIFSDFFEKSINIPHPKTAILEEQGQCCWGSCHREPVAVPAWLPNLLQIFGPFGRCCSEIAISDPYPRMEAGYRRSYLGVSWIRRGECVAD